MLTIKRGIERGFSTLIREKQWLTALGALIGVFILVQMLALVLVGLEGMQMMLRNRTDLRLEIQAGASDSDMQEFYSTLGQQSFVRNTVYITKEKAYEQTRQRDPDLIAFLEEFHIQNPFNDTIGVSLNTLDDYTLFASFVQQERWNQIINPSFLSEITDQEKQVYALMSVTRAGRSMTMAILMIAGTALIFITTELIRRRSLGRADEVMVERLVGASPLGIALPFITEASILLFISMLISAVLMIILIMLMPTFIPALQANGALGSLTTEIQPILLAVAPTVVIAEIVAAPCIATIGAWMGMRRQIRSPRISFAL
ncbi:MAG: permease-like cell division protein FtsX [Candidatus Peregrinibacteria bacterium]|nr:permease-like cell division protein FtsX [Candidatus Peregrinibacteria bacterium]MCB9808030.1 hypothetical protein [Candidatus Peribacteria bacterium]